MSTSTENYLETILILSRQNAAVRSIDIAEALDFTKPSVSVAMKNLRKDGCVDVDRQGFITLTARGQEIAESMYERHVLLSDWLVSLGVPRNCALEDACKIEHVISPESFEAIKKHYLKKRDE